MMSTTISPSAQPDDLLCERRCALHRIENVWVDNAHTVSGTYSHERADKPVEWKRGASGKCMGSG